MAEKREQHRDKYATQLERRLLELDNELEKAYDGWKRGVVPDELFLRDQSRIQNDRFLVEADLETVSIRIQRVHEMAALGVELARECGEAWRDASEAVRTMMAQAFTAMGP